MLPIHSRPAKASGAWSVYLYDLVLGNAFDGSNRVIGEALRRQPEGRGKSHRVFERAETGVVVADASFRLGSYGSMTIRSNASAIATLAQLGHPLSLKLREAAQTVWSNILLERADPSDADAARLYLRFPDLTAKLNREIDRIDLGIRGMQVSGDGSNAELLFHHQGLQVPMTLEFGKSWYSVGFEILPDHQSCSGEGFNRDH